MPLACVLDMDETLGFFDKYHFHVRPHLSVLIHFLRFCKIRTYIWSLGKDEYVTRMINIYMPEMKDFAFKIFARKESDKAFRLYGWKKPSQHIRDECDEDLILIGIDDLIEANMDDGYDLKLPVTPYNEVNTHDISFLKIMDEIMVFLLRNDIKIDYYSNFKTAFKDEYEDRENMDDCYEQNNEKMIHD